MVERDLSLAGSEDRPLHLMHLSARESVGALDHALASGVRATAEVTPHHLVLTEEAVRSPRPEHEDEHVLTDRGSCFTADGFERACEALGLAHRKTRPYTPKTNGMVERFNGRVQREVLGITVASHRDLETLLHGFNRAYNARRQRVLKGRSPEMVVQERLSAVPARTTPLTISHSDPCALPKALQIVARAKDVSHPDN